MLTLISFSLKTQIIPSCVIVSLLNVIFVCYFSDITLANLYNPIPSLSSSPKVFLTCINVVMTIILTTLSWVVSKRIKEILVFWQLNNIIPGHRAFTLHMSSDARVDAKKLKRKYGILPSAPKEQNQKWYSLYKEYASAKPVLDAHKNYLRYRELILIPLLYMLLSVVLFFLGRAELTDTFLAIAGLGIEYLVFMVAARNAGNSLVKNVLALASS